MRIRYLGSGVNTSAHSSHTLVSSPRGTRGCGGFVGSQSRRLPISYVFRTHIEKPDAIYRFTYCAEAFDRVGIGIGAPIGTARVVTLVRSRWVHCRNPELNLAGKKEWRKLETLLPPFLFCGVVEGTANGGDLFCLPLFSSLVFSLPSLLAWLFSWQPVSLLLSLLLFWRASWPLSWLAFLLVLFSL